VTLRSIEALSQIIASYDLILCDVWGVLHNGVSAFSNAGDALAAARERGKTVILITNSPRPAAQVTTQLDALDVRRDAYDGVVTSGDVTRTLIADGPRRVFNLGPDRDLALYDGLDVELVEDFEASGVVCTGLVDDENETLKRFRARNLPFICANPDIVVERGDRLIYCAGALAREYTLLGGRTFIAGKPHPPIYARAIEMATAIIGVKPDQRRVLAIGDGITTDVKGAMDAEYDLLFISDGIHAHEYGTPGNPDKARMAQFLEDFGAAPVATMKRLG